MTARGGGGEEADDAAWTHAFLLNRSAPRHRWLRRTVTTLTVPNISQDRALLSVQTASRPSVFQLNVIKLCQIELGRGTKAASLAWHKLGGNKQRTGRSFRNGFVCCMHVSEV